MRRIQRRLDRARLAPVNVARALALLLAVLVIAVGCDSGDGGEPQASTPNESEPIAADANAADSERDAASAMPAGGPNLGAERVVILAVDGLDAALLQAIEAEAATAALQATTGAQAGDAVQAQAQNSTSDAPTPALPNLTMLGATTRIPVVPPQPSTRQAVWTELQTGRAATKLGQLGTQRTTKPVGTASLLTAKLEPKSDTGAAILNALMLAMIFAIVGVLLSNHRSIQNRLPKKPGARAGVAVGLGVIGFVVGMISSVTSSALVQDYASSRPARAVWHDMAEAGVPVVVTNAPFSFPAIDDAPEPKADDEGGLTDEQKKAREEAQREAEALERTRLDHLSLLAGETIPDLHGPDRPQVFGENAPKNEDGEVDTTRDVPVLRARYRAYVETLPDHVAKLPTEQQLDVDVRRTRNGGEIVSLTTGRVMFDGERTTFSLHRGTAEDDANGSKAKRDGAHFVVPLIGPRNGDDEATLTSVPLAIERQGSRLNVTVGNTGTRSLGVGEWTPAIRYTVARKSMALVLVQVWLAVASVDPIVVVQTPVQAVPTRMPRDMAIAHPAGLEAALAGRIDRVHAALPANEATPFANNGTYPTAGSLTRSFAAAFADGFPRHLVRTAAERDMDVLRRLTLAHLGHTPWHVAITQIPTIADALPAFGAVDGSGNLRLKPGLLGTVCLLDALVGEIHERYEGAAIIVVGTHGSAPVHHVVNMNAWLAANGYLALRNDAPGSPDPARPLDGIDWEETRVVCLDGGRLLVNVTGRQPAGTVQKSAVDALLGEVITKLTTDPALRADGAPVIGRVDRTNNAANGDAVLVFNRGFALSAVTPLGGGVDAPVLEPAPPSQEVAHAGAWMNPPVGILLSNRTIVHDTGTQAGDVTGQIRLVDIAPTLLAHLGLDVTKRDGTPMRLRAPVTSEELSRALHEPESTVERSDVVADSDGDGNADGEEVDTADDEQPAPAPAEPRGQRRVVHHELTLNFVLAASPLVPAETQVHALVRVADREVRVNADGRPLASVMPRLLPGDRVLEVRVVANQQRGVEPLSEDELAAQARVVLDAWTADLAAMVVALQASADQSRAQWETEMADAEARARAAAAALAELEDAIGEAPNAEARAELEAEHARLTVEQMAATAERDALAQLIAAHEGMVVSLQPVLVRNADADKLGTWPRK